MIHRVTSKHQLNSVLIGMLLGDSYLGVNKSGDKAYLDTLHKASHKEYLLWKRGLISPYIKTSFKFKSNNGYPAFLMRSGLERSLIYLRDDFYNANGTKIIRKNILNRVTNFSLAIWYMDDGNLSLGKKNGSINRRNVFLNTHGFGLEGNKLIQSWLFLTYGIEANINQNRGYRIRLNTENTKKFLSIVYPVVSQIPCMMYKIDMKYKALPLGSRVQENSKRGES